MLASRWRDSAFPKRLLKAAASADSAGAVGAMASLRNPAIGILRLHSDRNIAAALGNAAQNIPICTRPEPATYRLQGAHKAARRAQPPWFTAHLMIKVLPSARSCGSGYLCTMVGTVNVRICMLCL
jgi:hypothetical protein